MTLKTTVVVALTVWPAGCTVIEGTPVVVVTARRTALLVMLPAPLLTTTRKRVPLSARVVAAVL